MTVGRIPSVEGGIQPTLLTAKGDLISATAASTVAVLPVGSDTQILVADSAEATGLKWAARREVGVSFAYTSGVTTTQTVLLASGKYLRYLLELTETSLLFSYYKHWNRFNFIKLFCR
jgi:hypothetical protein